MCNVIKNYNIIVIQINNIKYIITFLYKSIKSKLNLIVFINLLDKPFIVFNQIIIDVR